MLSSTAASSSQAAADSSIKSPGPGWNQWQSFLGILPAASSSSSSSHHALNPTTSASCSNSTFFDGFLIPPSTSASSTCASTSAAASWTLFPQHATLAAPPPPLSASASSASTSSGVSASSGPVNPLPPAHASAIARPSSAHPPASSRFSTNFPLGDPSASAASLSQSATLVWPLGSAPRPHNLLSSDTLPLFASHSIHPTTTSNANPNTLLHHHTHMESANVSEQIQVVRERIQKHQNQLVQLEKEISNDQELLAQLLELQRLDSFKSTMPITSANDATASIFKPSLPITSANDATASIFKPSLSITSSANDATASSIFKSSLPLSASTSSSNDTSASIFKPSLPLSTSNDTASISTLDTNTLTATATTPAVDVPAPAAASLPPPPPAVAYTQQETTDLTDDPSTILKNMIISSSKPSAPSLPSYIDSSPSASDSQEAIPSTSEASTTPPAASSTTTPPASNETKQQTGPGSRQSFAQLFNAPAAMGSTTASSASVVAAPISSAGPSLSVSTSVSAKVPLDSAIVSASVSELDPEHSVQTDHDDQSQVDEEDEEDDDEEQYTIPDEEICRKWNNGDCYKHQQHCLYAHICLYCHSEDHAKFECPELLAGDNYTRYGYSEDDRQSATDGRKDNEPCLKWNYSHCPWGDRCHRQHICAKCMSTEHRASDCTEPTGGSSSQATKEVCLNWNMNKCRLGDRCKRLHVCSHCRDKNHRSVDCPTHRPSATSTSTVSTSAVSTQRPSATTSSSTTVSVTVPSSSFPHRKPPADVCLNWNNGRCAFNASASSASSDTAAASNSNNNTCKRKHQCAFCHSTDHPAIQCTHPDATAAKLHTAGVDVCINWNRGKCRDSLLPLINGQSLNGWVGRFCKRLHRCSACFGEHPAHLCPHDKKS